MPGWLTNCGPMSDPALDLTEDAFLGGQLRLRQLKSGHRAGHDAVLLAAMPQRTHESSNLMKIHGPGARRIGAA